MAYTYRVDRAGNVTLSRREVGRICEEAFEYLRGDEADYFLQQARMVESARQDEGPEAVAIAVSGLVASYDKEEA